MADTLLDVEGIETCYGLSQVLFGLSLSIKPGEMVSLMGRNGMGKTTTIRSIMGLTPARAMAVASTGGKGGGNPSITARTCASARGRSARARQRERTVGRTAAGLRHSARNHLPRRRAGRSGEPRPIHRGVSDGNAADPG